MHLVALCQHESAVVPVMAADADPDVHAVLHAVGGRHQHLRVQDGGAAGTEGFFLHRIVLVPLLRM